VLFWLAECCIFVADPTADSGSFAAVFPLFRRCKSCCFRDENCGITKTYAIERNFFAGRGISCIRRDEAVGVTRPPVFSL